uniref:Uncharacterized protein n=1 Tax=Cyanothece sp. (strain PCC 7425 / ATCC 29141) TaxID=395961 RepID=B8HRT4_CYAP4
MKNCLHLPLADEPHLAVWQQYAAEADQRGTFNTLQSYLVQLQFPVQAGMSQQERYRAATLRGNFGSHPATAEGLQLKQPETLELCLHPSLAGKIPVLVVAERADFVTLVQALAHYNEPHPIPDSMGACMIQGLNNWDRIHRYKQQWSAGKSLFEISLGWPTAFKELKTQTALYQDRLIVLNRGYYSNVAPQSLNLSSQEWLETSLQIRREHECTHYFIARLFGKLSNPLWEELVADYWGIFSAIGTYRSDWFLRFMGLENYPDYREGGRLQNYIPQEQRCNAQINSLAQLLQQASHHLEQFTTAHAQVLADPTWRILSLIALIQFSLEQLADSNGVEALQTHWQELQGSVRLEL